MAGPELILTTVNCSLEQAKPKSEDDSEERTRNRETTQTSRAAAAEQGTSTAWDLSADWVTRK